MKWKIEIIDNQIDNCYELKLYQFKKINKWYQSERFDWVWSHSQILGKKYICPEIYTKKLTVEQYFEREVNRELKRDDIEEIYRIVITKSVNV